MNKLKLQIVEIDNGFLVGTPDTQVVMPNGQTIQYPGQQIYAKDLNEINTIIAELWNQTRKQDGK